MQNNFYPELLDGITKSACLAAALISLAPLANAQMQIPNPLIRPRSLTNPAVPNPAAPTAEAQAQAQRTPQPYPAGVPLSSSGLPNDDPYLRELSELKDRFTGFYVSAVVGRTAVLRRSAAQRQAGNPSSLSQTGTSMAPLPLSAARTGTGTRNDAMMVADGELLDAVSNTGTLMSKVAHNHVVIYHVQETMTMPGGRLSGRRAIVFSGEVEGSGASPMAPIVLERPDSTFKRVISVETKARSASAGTTDSQNLGGGAQPAAILPQ